MLAIPDHCRFGVFVGLGTGCMVCSSPALLSFGQPSRSLGAHSDSYTFAFAEGKVVEIWNHRDDLGLSEQLGAPIFAGSSG